MNRDKFKLGISADQARDKLLESGSIAAWAKKNNFHPTEIYSVLKIAEFNPPQLIDLVARKLDFALSIGLLTEKTVCSEDIPENTDEIADNTNYPSQDTDDESVEHTMYASTANQYGQIEDIDHTPVVVSDSPTLAYQFNPSEPNLEVRPMQSIDEPNNNLHSTVPTEENDLELPFEYRLKPRNKEEPSLSISNDSDKAYYPDDDAYVDYDFDEPDDFLGEDYDEVELNHEKIDNRLSSQKPIPSADDDNLGFLEKHADVIAGFYESYLNPSHDKEVVKDYFQPSFAKKIQAPTIGERLTAFTTSKQKVLSNIQEQEDILALEIGRKLISLLNEGCDKHLIVDKLLN